LDVFSQQEEERSGSLEDFVFINKDNLFVDTVVYDISSQIIPEVGFTDLVSEFTGGGHSLHLKGHGGSTFEITKLEVTAAHTSVRVEEFPDFVVVFGELFVVNVSVIFELVVQNVDGFFLEELSNFGVVVDHFSQVSFLHVRVKGSVSESGIEDTEGEEGQDLETQSEMPELVEED